MTDHEHQPESWTSDPLVARVAPSHLVRTMLTGLLMLVLGLWGIYDYVWAIPQTEEAFLRGETCRDVRSALDGIAAGSPTTDLPDIVRSINRQLESETIAAAPLPTTEWEASLQAFRSAIDPPPTISPTDLPEIRVAAMKKVEAGLAEYGDVNPPSKYDRPVQWLFILCLPFVPFYLASFARTVGKVYRLEPDGTLNLPEGTFPADQVADIDMHRWMSKSICWIVTGDERRIKLDAHIFKHLDVIVGVIANHLHPDRWGLDARPMAPAETENESDHAAQDGS